MAENKKRRLRKAETVRERSNQTKKPEKGPRRLHKVTKPLRNAANVGRKEYYLPLPNNKAGRFLNRRHHFFPRYFRDSWRELKMVTWPGRRESWKLTFAVVTFAVIFGLLVSIVDFGLDKLFRKVILKI